MQNQSLPHHSPRFRLPALEWVRGDQKSWIKPDTVAGVAAAAVVLPKALAYATVAGLARFERRSWRDGRRSRS